MEKAYQAALNSKMKIQHGAVLVRGNKVYSSGTNHVRGKYGHNNFCSTHAERDAIMRLLSTYKLSRLSPYCLLQG